MALPTMWRSLDALDGVIAVGFGCVVLGVALKYDIADALIVFGLGLLSLGIVAMRGRR